MIPVVPCACGHEKADHANLGQRGWCNGGCGRCNCRLFRRSRAKSLDSVAEMNMPETFEQMTDVYGVACDVHLVRTFRDGRAMGAGYDLREPATWFVYDRENATAKWHKHCGPMSTFEQACDWIREIREVA